MGTIAAPNASIPQTILDLRARLASQDQIERSDSIAHLVGLPQFKEIPRPGEAVHWDFSRWVTWGKDWQFQEDDQGGKSQIMRHTIFKNLIISFATTEHDLRVRMNVTAKFRRDIMGTLEGCANLAVSLIDAVLRKEPGAPQFPENPDDALRVLAKSFTGESIGQLAANASNRAGASAADHAAWAALPGIFRALDKELGISIRQAMNAIELGDIAEAVAFSVRPTSGISKPVPRSAMIAMALRGLMDERKALIKAESEKKQKERDALREQKQKQKDPGSEQKYRADIARTRAEFNNRIHAQLTSALTLVDAIKRQQATLDTIPFPDFPGAPTELIEQLASVTAERDAIDMDRETLKERILADSVTISRLEREHDASVKLLAEARSSDPARVATADLVSHILNHMNTNDIMALVGAITKAREKATVVQKLITTDQTSPQPRA